MASNPRKKRNPNRNSPQTPKYSSTSSNLFPLEPSFKLFPSSKADFVRLLGVFAVAASVAVVCKFIAASLNHPVKPFCDSNSELDDFLSDYCEPCPTNGECHDGKLECARGYRKHGKFCVEDGDINEAAKKLSKFAEVCACEKYAQSLCGGTGIYWVQEDELWNTLDEYKLMNSYGLDEAMYRHAKQRALTTIHNLLETRSNNHGIEEFKCPEFLVNHYTPLSCRLLKWIIKNVFILVPACALLLGCISVVLKVRKKHRLSVRAEQLYLEVCNVLEGSISSGNEPWVVASWLRDHLLSPKERKDTLLWKKVEELVQEDSRVDQYPKIVKGESKVVWEWQVEGSLSSSAKRKKSEERELKLKEHMNLSSHAQSWAAKAVGAIRGKTTPTPSYT
ncbi:unnamed protein product [Fraxinus pennsylvanica]|uniref:Man1/Src1-like C-terminal domain-containing protein n=1 Tax=Fraxinus pennsylvanica TaxID=56036 RepID=A0AAD1ZL75_9LAMI|nr:unnamed protein product [Fraxinus pennsylvanica]